MQLHRFCNVFRIFDRITQYLIRNVIEKGDQSPRECIFRIMVFRFFNRIETWERLQEGLGEISYAAFQQPKFHRILSTAFASGGSLYGPAYIIPSPRIVPGHAFENHLHLLTRLKDDHTIDRLLGCSRAEEAHSILTEYPGIGDFIAYQSVLTASSPLSLN